MHKTLDIKDYYVIGDLHTAALVSKYASIDWLCLPHFDDPSIFAKLLDDKAGYFSINRDGFDVESDYVKDTALLEFNFKNSHSEFRLRDFMVPEPINKTNTHFLIRKFQGLKGTSKIIIYFSPKLNYGTDSFVVDDSLSKYMPKNKQVLEVDPSLIFQAGKDVLLLYLPSEAKIDQIGDQYIITFDLKEGQMSQLILEYSSHYDRLGKLSNTFEKETTDFWLDWVDRGDFFDYARSEMIRSAITLKLMQFYPTGALVASPTTSLPESIGGTRNWDYRFVWIRDATFTLYAFFVLGYREEARKFFDFIHNIAAIAVNQNFDLSLFYTIGGKSVPNERVIEHLRGYKGSKPVRIGNGANQQFQLDVYGALIDAYYFMSIREMDITDSDKKQILDLADAIEKNWKQPDNGIWEVRAGRKHFTYSKVMAWVGINRVLRMKGKLFLNQTQIDRLVNLENDIKNWIWENCYDQISQKLVQYPGSKLQDGTNFLFVLLQFLDKKDPRTRKIIESTRDELCIDDVFVYRYLGDDGLPRGEGAFNLCTFWMISSLAIIGEHDEADLLLEKYMESVAGNGLLSEEIEPSTKEYLGNFPQAFSHLGLIMSAYYIQKYKKRFSTTVSG